MSNIKKVMLTKDAPLSSCLADKCCKYDNFFLTSQASKLYYTELLKKPDTFYLLQTRKYQIIDLSLYAYFNNKTLKSILRKNIFINYRT